MLPAIQQRSTGLNAFWKVTENCLKPGFQWIFREHSLDSQIYFSEHPVPETIRYAFIAYILTFNFFYISLSETNLCFWRASWNAVRFSLVYFNHNNSGKTRLKTDRLFKKNQVPQLATLFFILEKGIQLAFIRYHRRYRCFYSRGHFVFCSRTTLPILRKSTMAEGDSSSF